nr:barstar family protein [uncultured Caproiciproducens sp.]
MNCTKYFIPKQRVLNFSKCQYLGEIHQVIQRELELPEWYGQNLDALWDSITGIMYVPVDITIIFKPETQKSEELASEISKIIDVFKEAAQEYNEITLRVEM